MANNDTMIGEPGAIAQALLNHARNYGVTGPVEPACGVHYITEGPRETPGKRNPVWVIETEECRRVLR